MSDWRVVVRHVRYWRGAIQRWSTVYPLTGTLAAGNYAAVLTAFQTLDTNVCYKGPTAAASGTVYEVALYDQATGGVPVAVNTLLNWQTPGAWTGYNGAAWPSNTAVASNSAETALQVEWAAGLSRSGKPVTFKKWYHSVPETPAGSGADITAGTASAIASYIQTQINGLSTYGLVLGNASRLAATLPTVRTFFGNHQMPRGRRRKPVVTSSSPDALQAFAEGFKEGYQSVLP